MNAIEMSGLNGAGAAAAAGEPSDARQAARPAISAAPKRAARAPHPCP
jgi:hypothetical protein